MAAADLQRTPVDATGDAAKLETANGYRASLEKAAATVADRHRAPVNPAGGVATRDTARRYRASLEKAVTAMADRHPATVAAVDGVAQPDKTGGDAHRAVCAKIDPTRRSVQPQVGHSLGPQGGRAVAPVVVRERIGSHTWNSENRGGILGRPI